MPGARSATTVVVTEMVATNRADSRAMKPAMNSETASRSDPNGPPSRAKAATIRPPDTR
jgi:hypothetical protein